MHKKRAILFAAIMMICMGLVACTVPQGEDIPPLQNLATPTSPAEAITEVQGKEPTEDLTVTLPAIAPDLQYKFELELHRFIREELDWRSYPDARPGSVDAKHNRTALWEHEKQETMVYVYIYPGTESYALFWELGNDQISMLMDSRYRFMSGSSLEKRDAEFTEEMKARREFLGAFPFLYDPDCTFVYEEIYRYVWDEKRELGIQAVTQYLEEYVENYRNSGFETPEGIEEEQIFNVTFCGYSEYFAHQPEEIRVYFYAESKIKSYFRELYIEPDRIWVDFFWEPDEEELAAVLQTEFDQEVIRIP